MALCTAVVHAEQIVSHAGGETLIYSPIDRIVIGCAFVFHVVEKTFDVHILDGTANGMVRKSYLRAARAVLRNGAVFKADVNRELAAKIDIVVLCGAVLHNEALHTLCGVMSAAAESALMLEEYTELFVALGIAVIDKNGFLLAISRTDAEARCSDVRGGCALAAVICPIL